MKNIKRLNKTKIMKTIKKFVILNCILLVSLLAYVYFSEDENKIENSNLNKAEEIGEIWYSTIDEVEESYDNTYATAEETSKKIEEIGKKYNDIPVYTDDHGNKYITYESFGTSSDEGYDNYQAIYDAHVYANYYGYNVKAMLKTYHIYKLNQTDFIPIQTSTDWNDATFIIHDENINDLETRKYSIFSIESKLSNVTIKDENILKNIKINKETNKIPELSGHGNAMCIVYDESKLQYIRYGNNQNAGDPQRDIINIDNDGNILDEVQWDFDNISRIVIIPIPKETLIVENGNFITNLSNDEQEDEYFSRNLSCKRSNTKIENIKHSVDNKDSLGGPYEGFLNIQGVSNVTVSNCVLFSHKYEKMSNYDLFIRNSINIKIENVSSNDIEDGSRWGIGGTHYAKDITYENCTLNRIDSHTGVHNLTINNCTIGIKGITVVGSGELNISNSTILSNNYLIELRQDYGSTWNGEIYLTNCTYKPKKAQQLIYFKVSYDDITNVHNFGYDLYLPNIFIDGLTINDENSTYSDNNLYIFYNNEYYTGISNGDVTGIYNLPEKIYIKNYETTSGRSIKLFYQEFYENLEETGINYSIPLLYKKDVQILNSMKENIDNDTITNQDITVRYEKIEGIQTQVIVNSNEIKDTEVILSNNGDYEIQIKYSNYEGQIEEKNIKITVDKDAPQISGVENGKIYSESVLPDISDLHLKEVQLTLNGQLVEGYKPENEIKEEGKYELVAKDDAGNETKIAFEIKYKTEIESDEYKIDGQYIIGVKQNTTVQKFIEILNSDTAYDVYRDKELLDNKEIIATGDRIETEYGETFYIIVKGDITKDGVTNIKDLVKIRRNILGLEDFDEFQEIAADLAEDDILNIKDLVLIRRIILGLEV